MVVGNIFLCFFLNCIAIKWHLVLQSCIFYERISNIPYGFACITGFEFLCSHYKLKEIFRVVW